MKILIAVDGSPPSSHALQEALRLLPLQTAEVSVVHVCPALGQPTFGGEVEEVMQEIEARRAKAHAVLDAAVRALEAGGVRSTPIFREGDPSSDVLAAVHALDPAITVVGRHGHGALRKLLLGSVADAVVRHSHRPVLLVGA